MWKKIKKVLKPDKSTHNVPVVHHTCPSYQIAKFMNRVYYQNLTTTSGGNISIKDQDGTIWLTASGTDKGNCTNNHIVWLLFPYTTPWKKPNSGSELHPSIEHFFHTAVYSTRKDVNAIIHAHPPSICALAFSDFESYSNITQILFICNEICGTSVGFCRYATPGSEQLAKNLTTQVTKGFNCILLEHHGVVCLGSTIKEAFFRLEMIELCCKIVLCGYMQKNQLDMNSTSNTLPLKYITQDELDILYKYQSNCSYIRYQSKSIKCNFDRDKQTLFAEIVDFYKRANKKNLFNCFSGIISLRYQKSYILFLLSTDLQNPIIDNLICVYLNENQNNESYYYESSSPIEINSTQCINLHSHITIYKTNSFINSIITSTPPYTTSLMNTTNFEKFNSDISPECLYVLGEVKTIPIREFFSSNEFIDFSKKTNRLPVNTLLIPNFGVISIGNSLIQSFNRLEVIELHSKVVVKISGSNLSLCSLSINQVDDFLKVIS